ncbi:TetR/AcrR family transcriptional regulator [Novosphingobium mangrovi (ex Huang et al. 2023)]|uniref:TetR/AcrR family transcriptional regulator n=1 Tax=Novosphingobium mangrovi (ex Huang et al. 2023) TaxID=2976432 RepID=A0ABT2I5I0_9SPHN|nr:TetR/AcrR family transcriptional regulator [Novosphingobium mangrovi (ex Huang et al. 2023)]MCT2399853.1 TetR/AcrR family transcriptional regulator [Novosphingobium mangrovi (ex Huang et al. 2023)]
MQQTKDERLDAALLKVMGDGGPLNHDRVAEEAGVSRRTVYRRFVDQEALRARIWTLLTPEGAMPDDLDALLGHGLRDKFRAFDERAVAMTMAMSSVEGRAMRNERKAERVAAYSEMFSDAVEGLNAEDARQAIAAMQLLCSGFAWREMRDQWDLDADGIARASVWAIRALLDDLKSRDGRSLDAPLPAPR